MSVVAIIPARGGSKRIPNKNIKMFAGRPIMSYSISAAQETGLFDRIVVSTDSEEIAAVAKACGAEVPFVRSADLSDDFTGTVPVLLDALARLSRQGTSVDYFCCMYATAPFVQPEYIIAGFNLLRQEQASTAFSVATFAAPIFRSLKINSSRRIEMFWPEHETTRSNDLPEAYHDAGQFYWGDTTKFLNEKRLLVPDAVPVVIPRYLVHDIDTVEDWETAEIMFQVLRERRQVYEPSGHSR